MRLAITGDRLFRDLTRVTENGEQCDTGNQGKKTTQPALPRDALEHTGFDQERGGQ